VVVNQVASYSPHPLMPAHERVIITDTPLAGETIVEWMQRTGLAERIGRQPIRVTINGWRVGREVWKTCRPKPGTTIHIQAEVRSGGGGGGGKVLRTVAFIILAYLSYGTSTYLQAAGYSVGAATAASAAVMVAGSLAINALFPLPKPQLPSGQSDQSPNYALSGGSNRARPYEPMPIIMGTRRVYPDLGARPYTEFRDGEQYLFQVFDFGYNSGISLSDLKIGENAIENFTGVLIEESGSNGKLSTFPGNVDTIAGGNLDAGSPGPYITRTSSPDSTALAVEIDGVLFRTTDTGDMVPYAVGVDIQYRPVGGTTWTQVHIVDDSAPSLAPQGSFSIFGIQIPFGTAAVSKLRYDEAAANGVPGDITIVNSNRKPLRRTYRWEVPQGQYEVKVARTTPDEGDNNLVAEIVFTQLRCYQPDTADYTGRKRIAITIRASGQLNGTIETFNCMARAKTTVYGGGYALQLNDSNSYLEVPSTASLKYTGGDFTFELWFSIPSPETNGAWLFSKPWNGAGEYNYNINYNAARQLQVNLYGATSYAVSTVSAVTPDVTHHLALVLKSDKSVLVYVDGVVVSSTTHNISSWVPPTGDGNQPLAIGTLYPYGDGAWSQPGFTMAGKIEGACCYTRALTAAEVKDHYNGRFVDETSLLARWNLDEGTGSSAADASGNGNTGILRHSPIWVAGGADVPRASVQTSNPAWWLLESARGRYVQGRRVMGAGLPESRIDLAAIRSFSTWCDAQNLTFNYVFDQPITASDMLDAIALRGRATKSWGSGKLGVVWDAPDLPMVGVFSMSNTVAGSFEIEYMTEQLAEEVVVSFDNPELGYQRDTVRVLAPGITSPSLSRTIDSVGCTSKTEAAQDGNLYLANNIYRARRYRWQMDFEGMPLSKGEVGTLAQDLASFDFSGRLAEGSTSSVLQLDRAIILPASGAFVTIWSPDGTAVTKQVAPGNGTQVTALTLVSALAFNPGADANHPPYDYKFVFGTTSVPGRKVKLESVRPVSESIVELTAVDETPSYYLAASSSYLYTAPDQGAAPVISGLTLTEEGVRAGNGYVVKVTATFNITGDYEACDIRVSTNGGQWITVANNSRLSSAEFVVQDFSTVVVEVVAHGHPGARTAEARSTITKVINFAGQTPPASVTEFALDGNTFRWNPVADVDVTGYVIRFHYGENRTWTDAARLHDGVLPYSPKTFDSIPIGVCTFFITALDAAGLESVTPSIIVKDLGDLETDNVVVRTDLRALAWPGSVTGGSNVGGDLVATATTEFYTADDGPFYGDDAADFYEADVFTEMVYQSDIQSFPITWVGMPLSIDHTLEGQAVTLEYRTTNDNPFYDADAADFYGADADAFYGAETEFRPWIGALAVELRDYQLRVTTSNAQVQGAIRALAFVVDVPDVTEDLFDVVVPAGGLRLPIRKSYNVIKNVQLTLQGGSTGVSTRIIDRDNVSGPLVEVINATPVPVDGRVNAHIRGY
jgi:predicted phage tail protein